MKRLLVCCLTAMMMFTFNASAQTDVTGQLAGSSLEEVLGAVVEMYGNTSYGINISFNSELGVSNVTIENDDESTDETEIMSISSGSTWHYVGHVKGKTQAFFKGAEIAEKLVNGKDYEIYLKSDNNGGYYVYYREV